MRDLLLALGPLLGVIIGGVLAWVNGRSQAVRREARERKQLILGKLEELHQLLTDVIEYYRCVTFAHLRDPNKMRRVTSPTIDHVRFDRVDMLVGFYAPELSERLKEAARMAEEFAHPFTKLLSDDELDETEGASLRSSVLKHSLELIETYEQMQNEIIILSKNYL
jgi:hypothetical protein